MMTNARRSAPRGRRGTLASLHSVPDVIALWRQRMRQRRHLLALKERMYRDIGVTAGDAYRESRKPFWRA